MDLSLIAARLQATLVGVKSIGTVADMDTAIDGAPPTPSAFVMPLADAAVDADTLGGTNQRIAQLFGVVHVLANKRDATGTASLNDLTTLRLNLRAALVGWVPDAATGEPVHFRAGRLLRLDGDGRLWWMDEFELITYYWST
jgi:hypothetical protein